MSRLIRPASASVQLPAQLSGDGFQVHEVAKSTTCAFSHFILSTARLPEVCDGGKLCSDWLAIKPAIVEGLDSFLSIFLKSELDIDIAHQVISQVITDVHLLNLAVFFLQLCEDLGKEVVKMLLHLDITDVRQHTV